ncbi:Acyl-CoA dehydrogenase [Parafrankia irregularis]|uniref:Acyl-CoA dehydrogenase n=2 Tax=Parafrankia irregularis TaxID=795642 RepID=A0A0S4QU94_9ACTN|nr:acyl-CoA dehydrogenase family protein [Parafrankia sp. CH37]CUU59307.1 Acyl-CoA dehydrogenase [Parafrankia irregularis]
MDFAMTYTPEQEAFRAEVRAWLAENIPAGLGSEPAGEDEAARQYQLKRELGRLLGEKGWLYPAAPREFGGGGLDIGSTLILDEEMRRQHLTLPPYYDSGGMMGSHTILVWGTDEQKRRMLTPIYRGEVRTWQLLTEPEAGSDLASARLAARRDGDHYVLNGQKIFVGSAHGADRFWMITCTDPAGARHQNLSWFMVDAHLPGITVEPLPVLADVAEGHKNTVYFDDVRVPADCLVGGENNGWKVANTHLQLEHGAIGSLRRDPIVDRLVEYCRAHTGADGRPLIEDPDVRDGLADIHIRIETLRLLTTRNFWRTYNRKTEHYNGPQLTYLRKTTGLWLTTAILDLIGPAALTSDEVWGALDGHAERQQRDGIVDIIPGGTVDVQRVVIARALGVGGRKPRGG